MEVAGETGPPAFAGVTNACNGNDTEMKWEMKTTGIKRATYVTIVNIALFYDPLSIPIGNELGYNGL